jgi:uncharacterized protein YdeI (YjbR/CyaY-like superfamily)
MITSPRIYPKRVRKQPAQAGAKQTDGVPIKLFRRSEDWAAWLDREHGTSAGVWLRIAKKGSKLQSVTYQDALETALCYGWIDGQKRPENEDCWLQKFLPRSARSLWSKINREKALALLATGTMKPAGLAAIENAKRTGRWEAAYDSSSRAQVPGDFQAALEASPRAKAFFETLDKTNRYAVLWRIQTVKKPETRARKIAQFVAMLERKEKIHE